MPGAPGATGAEGPQGQPGTGLDTLDVTVIRGISWNHDAFVDVAGALALLADLRITLNRSLDVNVQRAQPHVVNVWLEVHEGTLPPQQLFAMFGAMKYSPQTVAWTIQHSPNDMSRFLGRRLARILIRFNCNYLIDQRGRAISATSDIIVPTGSPPLPGGILESWFWVRG